MSKKLSNIKLKERKTESYKLISMLCQFLKKYPKNTLLKKIYGQRILGYYDFGTDQIVIDYRKDIIPTLIHEFIHRTHPELCETDVLKKEKEIMVVITPRQCKHILKALAST
jgi:hypothetical protein